MENIYALLADIEQYGAGLSLDSQGRLHLINEVLLPDALREDLRAHRTEILAAFAAGLLKEHLARRPTPARRCKDCQDWFIPKHDWEIRCLPCWKETKGYTRSRRDWQDPVPEIVHVPVSDSRLPTFEEWSGMLMRLIKLTHPDRHQNSREANDVTRWLLEQRQKALKV